MSKRPLSRTGADSHLSKKRALDPLIKISQQFLEKCNTKLSWDSIKKLEPSKARLYSGIPDTVGKLLPFPYDDVRKEEAWNILGEKDPNLQCKIAGALVLCNQITQSPDFTTDEIKKILTSIYHVIRASGGIGGVSFSPDILGETKRDVCKNFSRSMEDMLLYIAGRINAQFTKYSTSGIAGSNPRLEKSENIRVVSGCNFSNFPPEFDPVKEPVTALWIWDSCVKSHLTLVEGYNIWKKLVEDRVDPLFSQDKDPTVFIKEANDALTTYCGEKRKYNEEKSNFVEMLINKGCNCHCGTMMLLSLAERYNLEGFGFAMWPAHINFAYVGADRQDPLIFETTDKNAKWTPISNFHKSNSLDSLYSIGTGRKNTITAALAQMFSTLYDIGTELRDHAAALRADVPCEFWDDHPSIQLACKQNIGTINDISNAYQDMYNKEADIVHRQLAFSSHVANPTVLSFARLAILSEEVRDASTLTFEERLARFKEGKPMIPFPGPKASEVESLKTQDQQRLRCANWRFNLGNLGTPMLQDVPSTKKQKITSIPAGSKLISIKDEKGKDIPYNEALEFDFINKKEANIIVGPTDKNIPNCTTTYASDLRCANWRFNLGNLGNLGTPILQDVPLTEKQKLTSIPAGSKLISIEDENGEAIPYNKALEFDFTSKKAIVTLGPTDDNIPDCGTIIYTFENVES